MIEKLGLGMAAIGRPQYINIRQQKYQAASLVNFKNKGWQLLDLAYENGIRYFDTAPGYGMAEQLLIDWLKQKADPNIKVATKWGYTYVANFDPNAQVHEIKEHSIQKLNEQWARSMGLLPNLKVYQIHSATLDTGVLVNKDILNRLYELKSRYNIKIGLTTTGANQVEVIKQALDVEIDAQQLFDVFQITFNILDQSLKNVHKILVEGQKSIVVKEALANGRLFPNNKFPKYLKLYLLLSELSRYYEVGIDAIALRFCIDSLALDKVLSGASMPTHLIQNIEATGFQLEEEHINKLGRLKVNPEEYWAERKKLTWN